MKRALSALRVVPRAAKLRVLALLCGAALLIGLPWLAKPSHPGLLLLGELLFLSALLGVLWCRIPCGLWLVPRDLHGFVDGNSDEQIAFSFDDGPTAGLTDALLDLLLAHGVRASFFVLLHKAETHPQIIQRIIREGHVLGLHGEDHRLPLWQSHTQLTQSLLRAKERLMAIAGQPITLFRPSHGVRTPALLSALRTSDLRLCMWDHGVWDTDAPPPATLLSRLHIVQSLGRKADRPRVLLLHDGLGDEPGIPPHAQPLLYAVQQFLRDTKTQPDRTQPGVLATAGEQLGLRAVDQPNLAKVRHDVAQVGDLGPP